MQRHDVIHALHDVGCMAHSKPRIKPIDMIWLGRREDMGRALTQLHADCV